jgi:hypothetical protein
MIKGRDTEDRVPHGSIVKVQSVAQDDQLAIGPNLVAGRA